MKPVICLILAFTLVGCATPRLEVLDRMCRQGNVASYYDQDEEYGVQCQRRESYEYRGLANANVNVNVEASQSSQSVSEYGAGAYGRKIISTAK